MMLDAANTKSYPGTGTAWSDLSGNGNNGTLVNSPTYSNTNLGGITYNGTSQYTSTGLTLSSAITAFTIQAAINPASVTTKQGIIETFAGGSNGFGVEILTTGLISLFAFYSGGLYGVASTTPLVVNTAYILAGIWSNNILSLYVNGSLINSSATSGTLLPGGTITLGSYPAGNTVFYNGTIYNASIYANTSLTADQITQNFNAYRGRYGI